MVMSTIIILPFHHLPIKVVMLDIKLLELKFFDVLKEDYGITLHQLAKVCFYLNKLHNCLHIRSICVLHTHD